MDRPDDALRAATPIATPNGGPWQYGTSLAGQWTPSEQPERHGTGLARRNMSPSQGGDTGSNPVGAAQGTPGDRTVRDSLPDDNQAGTPRIHSRRPSSDLCRGAS